MPPKVRLTRTGRVSKATRKVSLANPPGTPRQRAVITDLSVFWADQPLTPSLWQRPDGTLELTYRTGTLHRYDRLPEYQWAVNAHGQHWPMTGVAEFMRRPPAEYAPQPPQPFDPSDAESFHRLWPLRLSDPRTAKYECTKIQINLVESDRYRNKWGIGLLLDYCEDKGVAYRFDRYRGMEAVSRLFITIPEDLS